MVITDLPEQRSSSEVDTSEPKGQVDLSVVIPISERCDDLRQLYEDTWRELSSSGYTTEFIYVLDGPFDTVARDLQILKQTHSDVRIILLNHSVGEATALSVGFEHARGRYILTLASYYQVAPLELKKILGQFIEGKDDLVISWRYPRIDAYFNRVQSKVFHWIVKLLTGSPFHDISCGLRIMKAEVAKEVSLYGDLHRFYPLLALRRGFKVREIQVQQSEHNRKIRLNSLGDYVRRLLDIFVLFFLFRFTKKPLRFFGLIGLGVFGIGAMVTGYLGFERLFLGVPLLERPLLIASALMIVLGMQLFSVGLLGEIIIFSHSRESKEYHIREILD
ncbi:MAG: glycosyltransferase [Nitrospirota bacterium]|nr:MAG: glycosyltransferase [Nitrospirota bacterium]